MPDVLMPRLSDTMTEGIIIQWVKHEGDTVRRGEVLAEIETDKATMELEAHSTGVLSRIIAAPGTTVPIGQPIAVIGDESPTPTPAPTQGTSSAASAIREPPAVAPVPDAPPVAPVAATERAVLLSSARPPVLSSPLARARARDHGLDLAAVTGTGPGGRIVRADVEAAISAQGDHAVRPAPTAGTPVGARPVGAVASDDERIQLSTIRRITAQRLTESAAAPHFYHLGPRCRGAAGIAD